MSDSESAEVGSSKTFRPEIGTVDDVNDATRRFNAIINEFRKRGHDKIIVAIAEGDE